MTARTLIFTALLFAALAAPASAADFTVTLTHDAGDGTCDVSCTLRDAVDDAGPADNVILPVGTYTLDQGQLQLDGDSIVATNARTTTIEADSNERVIYVAGGVNEIERVTITGGQAHGDPTLNGVGGGIAVAAAGTLTLIESTVVQNEALEGGGIGNFGGTVTVLRSTITDNSAFGATSGAQGGGIFSAGGTTLSNSTVSGNVSANGETFSEAGGIHVASGSFASQSSTIADNQAGFGSAITGNAQTNPLVSFTHTIVASGDLFPCAGVAISGSRNIFDHSSCGTPVADALLLPLANNTGQTDTHRIPVTSPALNAGTTCDPTDQRGVGRAPFAPCDIGAFEYDGSITTGDLDVVTQVVNDNGGTKQPADFLVHVRRSGVDVSASPAPGVPAPGDDYTLATGQYTVTGAQAAGYTATSGGDCVADGSVLVTGPLKTCTVTYDDNAPQPPGGGGAPQDPQPPPPGGQDEQLLPPEAGKTVNALPDGTVKVKVPGSNQFVTLADDQQLPVGTIVDTLKGSVVLQTAGGGSARFFDGIFKIGQGTGAKPLTILTLVEKLSCPARSSAAAAAKGKKKRRLWGDGTGRFQTKGKHSAATVVGTKWLVEDTCTTTLTKVTKGRVSVRDLVLKKTVILKAGKKYVARAKTR